MPDRRGQKADVTLASHGVGHGVSLASGDEAAAGRPRILLVDGKEREPWYRGIDAVVDADWIVPEVADVSGVPAGIDLALVNDERAWPWVAARVCDLRRQQVPTLHVIDGVVEWRNTWENPLYTIGDQPGMPMFQPVLCHKIACLGRAQARLLESWGNAGVCEVVGALRLDPFIGRPPRRRPPDDPPRVLIATARTPGFTPQQTECAMRALRDLRDFFSGGRSPAQVLWRIPPDVAAAIGVATSLGDTFSTELMDQLAGVDAFICTPSTALLEGMLTGVPVATIDYTNSPPFNTTAWSITARDHIPAVVADLLSPPPPRMLLQDAALHDQLECVTPARDRLRRLILEMVAAGREARRHERTLSLPARILGADQASTPVPTAAFDLATLYPGHSVFGQRDTIALQAEVGHLRRELARLPQALRDAQRQAEDARRQAEDELRRLNNSLTLRIVRPFHRLLDVVRHQLPTAQRRSRRTNLSRGHAVSRHESTTGLEHATQRLHKADDVFATERQYLASRYPSIDSEMEANRREFLTASPESRGHTAYRTYGQLILGPPLAAFGAWVVLQCKARRIDRVYCVLREGRFLSELLAVAQGAAGYQLDIRTLFASRFCLRSASLASGSQREMMDFCSGVRPADLQPDLLEYVGLFEKADTATWLALGIGERDPAARLDYIREVYRESEDAASRISALAKTRKQGLLTYLNRCDIPRSSDFVVVDLGWGGTMQAALVPFLRELGIDSAVRGFYLGTDARIASLSKATCPWHSFLYSVGKPGRHAALIRRTPELLEQCCMAPTGSLKEFRPDGSPELFPNRLPTLQLEQTAEVQRGILDYAMRWLPRLLADTDAHDALARLDHLSPVLRAIVSRSIDSPTPEEAALFAHWQHDSNNGSDGCQRIIGTPDAARGVRTGRVIHPDELDWLASYWPQGLFTHLGIAWSRKHWSGGLRSTIEKVQTVLMRS